jgi:hypothetical protein
MEIIRWLAMAGLCAYAGLWGKSLLKSAVASLPHKQGNMIGEKIG